MSAPQSLSAVIIKQRPGICSKTEESEILLLSKMKQIETDNDNVLSHVQKVKMHIAIRTFYSDYYKLRMVENKRQSLSIHYQNKSDSFWYLVQSVTVAQDDLKHPVAIRREEVIGTKHK